MVFVVGNDCFFRSTDQGTSWKRIPLTKNTHLYSAYLVDSALLICTDSGVYVALDQLDTLIPPAPTGPRAVGAACIDNKYLIVEGRRELPADTAYTVYRSSDNGVNWIRADTGLYGNYAYRLFPFHGYLFAGGYGGVFRSSDEGNHWENIYDTDRIVELFASNGCIFAEVSGKQTLSIRSTDLGASWQELDRNLAFYSVTCVGKYIMYLESSDNVAFSVDSCSHWSNDATGVIAEYLPQNLCANSTEIFLGTDWGGLWQQPISQLRVPFINDLTASFASLSQNYPNPTNSSTTISFTLSKPTYMTLTIADVLGREITTLISKEMPSGEHSVRWNGGNLPAGVYQYRLTSGNESITRKLVILK
jgi:photosystem II stability/assembly factor-like uncharacterized protein